MSNKERTALFIDGANLYATARTLGMDLDYKKLLKGYQDTTNLLRAYYFTALLEDVEYQSIRPLIDWLDYNGFCVVTKPAKEFVDATTGFRKVKGNMDVEMAVTMLEVAPKVERVVLFTGDGDFRSAVEAVQRKGAKVTVVSTNSTKPPMVADELRRQADEFVDLVHMREQFGREPRDRAP